MHSGRLGNVIQRKRERENSVAIQFLTFEFLGDLSQGKIPHLKLFKHVHRIRDAARSRTRVLVSLCLQSASIYFPSMPIEIELVGFSFGILLENVRVAFSRRTFCHLLLTFSIF